MNNIEDVIHSRRSNIFIKADVPIGNTVIERMIAAAQAAPNHKRTRPLRVCVVSGDSRRALGEVIATVMESRGEIAEKIAKARTKYLRAPVVLVVASTIGDTDMETTENQYAVAAGIQNMLLVATTEGLATLWGSPAKGAHEATNRFCGFSSSDHVVGLVYVGMPDRQPPPTTRPEATVTHRS